MAQQVAIFGVTLDYFLRPISGFLADPAVSEVMINGPREIYVEKGGKLHLTDATFEDDDSLIAAIRNIVQFVGKRLDPEHKSMEARLPDGSRVHIVLPPCSQKGPCVSIRKFSKEILGMDALIDFGALSRQMKEFIQVSVLLAKNIIVSGGTGTGKTTLLNSVSSLISKEDRIIVLEDSTELQLQQPHVLSFEAQAPDRYGRGGMTIRDLFRASLRMRPDRIVIGECRGGEALDMIQAMTSGHSGSLSTLHANSPLDAMNRLETMALMSGVELPLIALRSQVASAVDLVIQIARFNDGSRRITSITEVLGLNDQGKYALAELFMYEVAGKSEHGQVLGDFRWTGNVPSFWKEPRANGIDHLVDLNRDVFRGRGKEKEPRV